MFSRLNNIGILLDSEIAKGIVRASVWARHLPSRRCATGQTPEMFREPGRDRLGTKRANNGRYDVFVISSPHNFFIHRSSDFPIFRSSESI